MIVTKDTSVNFPFFIIKDFLPNPELYRKMVLEGEYDKTNGYWVGDNVILPQEFKDRTLEYILDTAAKTLNDYVWTHRPFISFRRLEQPRTSELAAHVDRPKEFDFDNQGRPIYANYKYWAFILDFTPQDKSARFCFCENDSGERFVKASTLPDLERQKDFSKWSIYKDFYYSYNTAIMFPAHFWHTAIDFTCSKELPRTMAVTWFYSGFNAKYNKCGIPSIDE
jgi:hypothetical protein